MFPQGFYKTEQAVQLLRTDVPTGLLSDPLDLINSPRPWLTVNPTPEETRHKKALIFADHFYLYRSLQEQRTINKKLAEARNSGFCIFIVSSDGMLKEWDGSAIPNDYCLDLKRYTDETIRTLAWSQHQLAADNFFLLDYFGINELSDRSNNYLNFSTFEKHPEQFVALVNTAKCNVYEIKFGSIDQIAQFLKLLDDKKIQLNKFNGFTYYLTYLASDNASDNENVARLIREAAAHVETMIIRHVNLENCTPGQFPCLKKANLTNHYSCVANDVAALLSAAPHLEDIDLSGCEDIKSGLEKLKPGQLSYLKRINLKNNNEDDSNVSLADVMALLNAASNLEEIDLSCCRNIASSLEKLKSNQLSHLKKINLAHSNVNAADITTIFHAAPHLEEIDLSSCHNIASSLEKLKSNQLSHLKKINLAYSNVNAADIATIFHAAPHLEEIDLGNCQNVARGLKNLNPSQLLHLKKINLCYSNVSATDITTIFHAAPHLEEIDLSSCHNIASSLEKLKSGQLPHLKKINLANSNVNAADIATIFRAAPHLEEIDLGNCQNIAGGLKDLKPSQLLQLKKINLRYSNVSAIDITVLFSAAPNLEEIDLANCQNIASGLEKLKSGQLPHLKKIYLRFIDVSTANVLALFNAAPHLEDIDLAGNNNIASSLAKIKPSQLLHLKEIDLSTSATATDVAVLLNIVPNLKKVRLEYCENIAGSFQYLKPNQLHHLEEINLRGSNVSIDDIKALQQAAPNAEIHSDHSLSFQKAVHAIENKLLNNDFFNTATTDRTHFYEEYFPGVCPSRYRLTLWTPDLNTLDPPPRMVKADDFKSYTLYKIEDHTAFASFKGVKPVTITDGQEIILQLLFFFLMVRERLS